MSGVVRVEKEIAARLPGYLGDAMSFIWFDRDRGDYLFAGQPGAEAGTGLRDGDSVQFLPGARYVSFGLECNTKDYRHMLGEISHGQYELYSVLYDLTGPLEPQLTIEGYGEYLRGFFADMTWGVSRFLAISEHSKRQLGILCAQEFLTEPDCAVFPLGCDLPRSDAPATLPAALKDKVFALLVSTIEVRKNHYALYRAFDRALADGLLDPDVHRLVFAGKVGWGVDDLMEQIRVNPRTADTVICVEGLSDASLAELYRQARVCAMPSLDEGYGLPLAEALGLGKICLSSTAGALPEVGADVAHYIDPLDILGWRDALVTWLTAEPDAVAAQEQLIRRTFKPVSWDDSAAVFARLVQEDPA